MTQFTRKIKYMNFRLSVSWFICGIVMLSFIADVKHSAHVHTHDFHEENHTHLIWLTHEHESQPHDHDNSHGCCDFEESSPHTHPTFFVVKTVVNKPRIYSEYRISDSSSFLSCTGHYKSKREKPDFFLKSPFLSALETVVILS